uniref:Putative secreted protein n=1 Tax=Anopheles darlingi TaxID=43151 RepID=A0A2M4DCT0_ANODA
MLIFRPPLGLFAQCLWFTNSATTPRVASIRPQFTIYANRQSPCCSALVFDRPRSLQMDISGAIFTSSSRSVGGNVN